MFFAFYADSKRKLRNEWCQGEATMLDENHTTNHVKSMKIKQKFVKIHKNRAQERLGEISVKHCVCQGPCSIRGQILQGSLQTRCFGKPKSSPK